MAIMTGSWWAFKDGNILESTIFLIALWVFVFNYLPSEGIKCLKHPEIKYFALPLALIGSLFYSYGFISQSA